jgi:hypothetical protein
MTQDAGCDAGQNWLGMSGKEACEEIVFGSVRYHSFADTAATQKPRRPQAWLLKFLNTLLIWRR